jgi:hypothetical protein
MCTPAKSRRNAWHLPNATSVATTFPYTQPLATNAHGAGARELCATQQHKWGLVQAAPTAQHVN